MLSRLADEWLALLRAPPLVQSDLRHSNATDVYPALGIILLGANDLVRFFANDLVHRGRLRRRMVRSAIDAGLPRGDARRFVGIFEDAYADATRFSTDVDHQRRAVRSALGL